MKRRSNKLALRVLALLALVAVVWGIVTFTVPTSAPERDVARTMDALKRDKESQQTALDDIAVWPKERHVLLYRYLDDHRPIASRDVLLLNTFPERFEKYFMTEGNTVGDAVGEYLCWTTEVCDFNFRGPEPSYRQMQYRALQAHCRSRYDLKYCPVGRPGT